jgi:glucose-1-phosphate cytidylyltransferase
MLNSKDDVVAFREKPAGDGGWINGGFFVMEPQALKYIRDDRSVFEKEPLEDLAKDKQLNAYKHSGFWQPMDTLRDKIYLDQLWVQNKAPWKQWK